MNGYEWAAVIGATAWVPQIIRLIKRILIKPIFSPYFDDFAIVTNNSFGPTLSLQCSLLTEAKDAVIEDIELLIQHEDGESHTLKWDKYVEILSNIYPIGGGGGAYTTKGNNAIILRLQKDIQFNINIFFIEINNKTALYKFIREVKLRKRLLKKGGNHDFEDELLNSDEYHRLMDQYENSLFWKTGEFKLKFIFCLKELNSKVTKEFTFSLDTTDIETLLGNKKIYEKEVSRFVISDNYSVEAESQDPVLYQAVEVKIK